MRDRCSWGVYEGRLRRVTAYIHEHLDEELDMARLADVACMSPYHWHRIYRAVNGETLTSTVKRLRLQRAAAALAETDLAVAAIAVQSGYPNLQSFSRTFKAVYGLPPQQFRRHGGHADLKAAIMRGDTGMYDVNFRDMEPVQAIGIDHRGPYPTIGQAFDTLNGLLAARDLYETGAKMYGIYYDDPEAGDPAALRSAACCATTRTDIVLEPPLHPVTVAGGRFAVLTHKGPYSDLGLAYAWLYGQWLPSANLELRNAPPMEIYVNTPRDTAPADLITEICIAVA